ncbi:hypothetical protein CLTEP_00040 [Clostridium tepidiprofundi DSM 19306]|uniref:Flagellar protein n=1 Tax=Clostridium tepidiprofundi DSM 19306 TaxID=1121338 RepID=A0A151B6P1_9CLOT|nr:flagellar biosynthetic protein FliO [Clostridium tepidiprofundi]KYH35611.1 hypothetical protein CLTEP_00040 [Clostridium tepidiprofundi DSM 19306]
MDDLQLWKMVIEIVIFLPFIIFLIYFVGKYGSNKFQNIQNGKIIKILERVPISKDNSLLIVKIADKYYLISSSNGSVEVLFEIESDYIANSNINVSNRNLSIQEVLKRIKGKKED